jgi:hypothetical protein
MIHDGCRRILSHLNHGLGSQFEIHWLLHFSPARKALGSAKLSFKSRQDSDAKKCSSKVLDL